MGDAKSIKERGILEQVIKSELDFITYVDVHTGTFHVIVTNDDTDVTPPPEGADAGGAAKGRETCECCWQR